MPRKSKEVTAGLLIAIAAQLAANGCGPTVTEVRQCVDGNGVLLPDYYCEGPYPYSTGYYYGHPIYGHPVYVYGGTGRGTFGSHVSGYRTVPTEGAHVFSSSGAEVGQVSGGVIQRRGFGSSSFGSGGSFGG